MDENLKLVFSYSTNKDTIKKYKGSKYVQSYIGNSYNDVKKFLNENKKVIFIGTPCQIAGLNAFLNKPYDNLITVDLICHGIPSQKYLDDYIESLNLPEKPDNISFRGLHDFYFSLYKNNNLIFSEHADNNKFFSAFLAGLFYRENCYSCEYANTNRVGDITIGDFWGLGKDIPFEHDKTDGVSVVLINTEKGSNFFKNCKNKLFYEERSLDEAVAGNNQLRSPSSKHENYDLFIENYLKSGIKHALEKTI